MTGIALNLQIASCNMDILTIVHEHEMSFHLFMASLISFSNTVGFSVQVFHVFG